MFRTPRPRLGHSNALRFRPKLVPLDDRITPTLSFAGPQSLGVWTMPRAAAVGDFNGDGRPDIATANDYPNINTYGSTVSVLVNTTPVGGVTPSYYLANYFTGDGPGAIAAGDFNGDGRADLVTLNSGTASVLTNTTPTGPLTPAFEPPQTFALGSGAGVVATGDFNGDGRLDISAAGGGGIWIVSNTTPYGSSTPTFAAPQQVTAGANGNTLALGDFNGDGRVDLAAVATTRGCGPSYCAYTTDLVLLSNTTATGAAAATFVTDTVRLGVNAGYALAYFVATGDFDGDGRTDIALTSGVLEVSLLPNRTPSGAEHPTFDAAQHITPGAGAIGPAAVADFDGDGRADLAVPNSGNTVSVIANVTPTFSTSLTFATPYVISLAGSPVALTSGDFDADGRTDLAAVDTSSSLVTVLPNSSVGSAVTGPPVVGQFGTAGVWRLNRTSGGWDQLTAANADAVAVAPNGIVVASFGDNGLWYYQPAYGWYLINGHRATAVAIDGLGNVAASFAGFGTAQYRLADGWTAPMTSVAADRLALNGSGELVADFPGFGVYTYTTAGGWQFLHGYPITALALGENGNVTVSFVGFGVNVWRPTGDWARLNDADATDLAASADGSVTAAFAGGGVGKFVPSTAAWQVLHTGTPVPSVATDLYGSVFATLGGFGVYEFNPFTGWRVRDTRAADFLAVG